MKKTFLCLLMTLAVHPALADGEVHEKKDLCRILEPRNNPRNNAGANYIPNVDVYGKSVISADVSAGATHPDPIIIPIEINLAERFGLDLPAGAELKPTIAILKFYPDGRIEYGNQDITKKITSGGERPENPPPEIVKSDGQKAADAVVSSDKIDGQYPETK